MSDEKATAAWWKAEADGWRRENDRHRALHVAAAKDRDVLRAVVGEQDHALQHVIDCPMGCAECHTVARSAIARENLADFIDHSTDASIEHDRLRAVVDAVREYRAVIATRTANLADGGPDLHAEGELSNRARMLTRTIDETLAQLDGSEDMGGTDPSRLGRGEPTPVLDETEASHPRQGEPIGGWGVWHADDEEWIGFGATNGIAAELIPVGPDYEHLSLRPVFVYIEEAGDDRCTRCCRTTQECATQFEDVGFGPMCCEDCSHLPADVSPPGRCAGTGVPVNGPPEKLTGPCHVCDQIVTVADDYGRAVEHSVPSSGGDQGASDD